MNKRTKIIGAGLLSVAALGFLGACGNKSESSKSDNKDYRSYLAVTFENTTEDDYDELMEHYQSASTGTDEEGFLLFDWGRLHVNAEDDSILLNAYMK